MSRLSIAAFVASASFAMGACTHHVVKTEPVADDTRSDAAWAALDANRDGVLSMDEIEAQHMVGLQQDLAVADANGDGSVSRAEWNAWWPRMTKSAAPPSLAGYVASSAR